MADNIKREWFTVINPNAGRGKGAKDWDKISSSLKRNKIDFHHVFTTRKAEAIDLVVHAVENGFRNFISIGGDGTLNEIVNGAMRQNVCGSRDITIGVIPVGTGNDWGKMFGIPLSYDNAARIIKNRKVFLHDVGVFSCYYDDVKKKTYFINTSGLGFEAVVIKKTNRQKENKRHGKLLYLYNLISGLLFFKSKNIQLTVDDRQHENKMFSMNIGNGRFCGGGMKQTPEALPNDGLLDVTVINDMKKTEIVKSIRCLYDGSILSNRHVDNYKARHLTIESNALLYVEADGESFGHTPAEFGIIPQAVNMVIDTCDF